MPRRPHGIAWFVALAVAFPALCIEAWAQSPPTVTISPRGKLVTTGSIALTIDFCKPYAGVGWASQAVKLNGVNVSSSFTVGGGPGQTPTCDVVQRWTGTVTLAASPPIQTIKAEILDVNGYYGSDEITVGIPQAPRGVRATSPKVFATPLLSSNNSQTFTITNTGDVSTTYALSASCNGGVVSCSVSPTSTSGGTVTVSFTASATLFDTGSVKLTAVDNNDATIVGSAWTDVSVRAASPAGYKLGREMANVERSRCVTVSAGSDAAMQCGDLRIVHPLPGVVTLGQARVPTLIYNSQVARPMPVVLTDFTMWDTLQATVGAVVRDTVNAAMSSVYSYPGSDWGATRATRRMAIPVNASAYSTSLRWYSVCVGVTTATCVGTPLTGYLAVVNRAASNFGGGWWLAGLEELYFKDANAILWVGGDGSTKVYTKVNATTFKAPAFEGPDSITVSGSNYIRWRPAKLRVQFNSTGLHTSTTNRLGHVTNFTYNAGTRQLSTISVPVKSGSPLVYTFYYDGNSVLDSVVAPNAGVARVVRLARTSHQITSITDPDGSVVRFTYGSGSDVHRIASRIGRRSDTTTFSYNSVNQLTQSSLSMGSGQYITQAFRPAESAYAGGIAYSLDSAYTSIDGPRTDLTDVTRIWTNLYGQPYRIRNALGEETAIGYGGIQPALIRLPSRLRTLAWYNADYTLNGTAAFRAVESAWDSYTSYQYDPTWKFVSSVHYPQGDSDTVTYDATSGNRLSEVRGGVAVTYGYNSAGLDSTVTVAGAYTTRIAYNALGNASAVTSPKGYVSYRYQNAIGQDTLIVAPFGDTTHANGYSPAYYARVRRLYSRAGRDSVTITAGPAVGSPSPVAAAADSLIVENAYDGDGNVTSIWRKYTAGGSARSFQNTYARDLAGRVTYETTPSSSTTHTLDAAGNETAVTNGNGRTVVMGYDALNRMTRKVTPSVSYGTTGCATALLSFPYACYWSFPIITPGSFCIDADTSRFTFDGGGNLIRADNKYAQIRRTYTQGGLLATDTLAIRTVGSPGDTPCALADSTSLFGGSEFDAHRYGVAYQYDLGGRRTNLQQPYHFGSCGGTACAINYSYDSSGRLARVWDDWSGRDSLIYDAAGRLNDVLVNYNTIADHRSFDAEDQVVHRTITSPAGTLLADSLRYDAAGRLAVRKPLLSGVPAAMWYGPMGAVISAGGATNSYGGATSETFVVDAIGNRRSSQALGIRPSNDPDVNGVRTNTIGSGGQLTNVTAPTNTAGFSYDQNLAYDGSGNLATTQTRHLTTSSGSLYEATINYYDGADRLRIFNRATGPFGFDDSRPGHRSVSEEYRYDALERRVWVRSRRGPTCQTANNSECSSYVERTMYDGPQIAMQIRSPGASGVGVGDLENDAAVGTASTAYPYGKVAYVHGPGIDQPLAVLRMGLGLSYPYIVFPHANWRGQFAFGSLADGTVCAPGSTCIEIAWPGGATTADGEVAVPHDGSAWFGSLIANGTDGSGLQYKRNRFYDPATGRFTQEDPIGLAGGMNLYGFAGGDPVNFSDPFGLCPKCKALKIISKGVARGGAAAAADGPLPIGDAIGAAMIIGSIVEAAAELRNSRSPVYHRTDITGREAALVAESGELWGQAPRNTYASDIPQVKAWPGHLKAGEKGIEFTTTVVPDAQTPPGRVRWSGPRPGVVVEDDYAKIRVTLTKVVP